MSTKRSYVLPAGFASAPSPTASNDSAIDSCSSNSNDIPDSSTGVTISGTATRKRKLNFDKDSDKYRQRRERNNQAVRKSRAKAKSKKQAIDDQVRQLMRDKQDLMRVNQDLVLKVEVLEKELNLIRSWVGQEGKSKEEAGVTAWQPDHPEAKVEGGEH
ncbi:hypothetical protein RvY_08317 [Ramazzottius varieornatus]|uniref:BZIP domain-containing protein n=1 Tax=Ramazzottius varieornatus TaxID=947166 RepID=A0A1D1VDK3_RAMVA|nr:hypothetical protein RvY_08317 [Ramazzottius varieornatus]